MVVGNVQVLYGFEVFLVKGGVWGAVGVAQAKKAVEVYVEPFFYVRGVSAT